VLRKSLRRAFLVRAILAAAFAGAVGAPAFAADPTQVVNQVSSQVLELLKTKQGLERKDGFAAILNTNFDLPYMGQSALGRYWASTNEAQRVRFLKAAANAEARAYAERFGQYGGQTVNVGKVNTRPGGVYWVDSTINQSSGPPIKVEWEVQDRGGGMRITDVKVEGVSMVMTRRSDFSSYISRNGGDVEALIKELESRGN
jgi:phospholipid transport system substrate-binding protein